MSKLVGQSIKRKEDPRFIQGKGSYVANLNILGMAHLAIKRSPHAHAKILSIDTSKAAAMPGVIAVFTGQDLIDGGCGKLPCGWNVPNIKVPTRWAIQPVGDKVRHVGDAVAVIVAETRYIAQDALDLIDVEYEVLPASIGAKATVTSGIVIHDDLPNNTSYPWAIGDLPATEAGLAAADHVVELKDLINTRLIANAMEPRAAAAQWNDMTEDMTLWTTSQNPHPIRLLLSAFTLGIPEHKLRVISPDVGGGFGSKILLLRGSPASSIAQSNGWPHAVNRVLPIRKAATMSARSRLGLKMMARLRPFIFQPMPTKGPIFRLLHPSSQPRFISP